jgi:short-subunit dehydrogenase
LCLVARNEHALKAVRREVEDLGARAVDVIADLADSDQLERAAQVAEDEFGPIEVWVNNAMTSLFSPVMESTPDEVRRVTEVTYLGVVNGTLAALKRMVPRDSGIIVQVGSVLAYRAIPLQAAYCAAKHAVKGFTESLRTELLHDRSNVRVTMVQLPGLNTPQFDVVRSRLPNKARPVPPVFQPEVAAGAILWAAHHPRREVWVSATTAVAIVANKVIPGLLDRYLARTNFEAQQGEEPEDPEREYNLWRPVSHDPGVYGRFGDQAHPRSWQLWSSQHRPALTLGAGLASCAAGLWWRRSRA